MELNTVVEKGGRSYIRTHETKYTWLIRNVRNCPFEKGSDYVSGVFTAGETNQYTWNLQLCLNGYDADDYVSIWPEMLNLDAHDDFEAVIEISILDEQTKNNISKRTYISKKNLISPMGDHVFLKFIKKDDLLKIPSFLTRGELTIVCSIYLYIDCEDVDDDHTATTAVHETVNEHLADFEKLLFNDEFSDFHVIVGDTKIPVHRAILAARSRVFSAMLSSNMLEKEKGTVTIENIEVDVMRELLRFVYIGQVCELGKIADKLLIAADKYELNSLKQICENKLAENLDINSIFETLQLVDRYEAPTLKKAAIDFVLKKAKHLVEKNNFEESIKLLSPELSMQVIRGLIAKS